MADYGLPDSKRQILVDWLTSVISTETFTELQVLRLSGASENLQGSFEAEECSLFDPTALVDEIIERYGATGGKYRIRAVFGRDDDGKLLSTQKRTVVFSRTSTGSRTESRGTAAGVEALSSSLAGSLDVFQRQVSAQAEQQTQLTEAILTRADANSHHQLDQAAHYMRTIMDLQVELSTARLELALAQREPVIGPEVMREAIPAILALVQSISTRLIGGEAAAQIPQDSPAPEAAPPG